MRMDLNCDRDVVEGIRYDIYQEAHLPWFWCCTVLMYTRNKKAVALRAKEGIVAHKSPPNRKRYTICITT